MVGRLLLAEDDENDAMFLSRALRKAGFPVPFERVTDGVQAVKRLVDGGITHALLDLKMPRKSGLDVLEWLAGRVHGVRAAIFSSSTEEEDVRRAYELGAEFYLVKPASTQDLLDICGQLGVWVDHDARPTLSADLLVPRPA
jgi:DNA-binding response OmpR family regulator